MAFAGQMQQDDLSPKTAQECNDELFPHHKQGACDVGCGTTEFSVEARLFFLQKNNDTFFF
jgi:hypothetical protein